MQVAIEPSLLYENTYEAIPGYLPKEPTAAQVATNIRAALAMTIFNAGQTPIEVRSFFLLSPNESSFSCTSSPNLDMS